MSWLLAETVVYTTIESKDGVFGWTEHEGLHWATETRARKHFQNMVKVFLAAEISMSRYALEQHRPRTKLEQEGINGDRKCATHYAETCLVDQEDPDIEAYLDRSLVEAESLVGEAFWSGVEVWLSACQAHEAGGSTGVRHHRRRHGRRIGVGVPPGGRGRDGVGGTHMTHQSADLSPGFFPKRILMRPGRGRPRLGWGGSVTGRGRRLRSPLRIGRRNRPLLSLERSPTSAVSWPPVTVRGDPAPRG